MTVLMFFTYCSEYIAILIIGKKTGFNEDAISWAIVAIVKVVLSTISLWIGIYTFNLFAT